MFHKMQKLNIMNLNCASLIGQGPLKVTMMGENGIFFLSPQANTHHHIHQASGR
jgi:hypothetical protein